MLALVNKISTPVSRKLPVLTVHTKLTKTTDQGYICAYMLLSVSDKPAVNDMGTAAYDGDA